MPVIDHITYQVRLDELRQDSVLGFLEALGFEEIEPDAEIEKGWSVRWFQMNLGEGSEWAAETILHLVGADNAVPLGLSHFCVILNDESQYQNLRASRWLERDSGSGRIWLQGPCGLRVEVRP